VRAFRTVAEELARRVKVALDGVVQLMAEQLDIVLNPARGDGDRGCVERRASALEGVRRWLLASGEVAAFEPGLELVPGGVVTGGERLADARGAVADPDVALAPAGVGELGETAALLGNQERGR